MRKMVLHGVMVDFKPDTVIGVLSSETKIRTGWHRYRRDVISV